MKKINYVLIISILLLLGIGVVNAEVPWEDYAFNHDVVLAWDFEHNLSLDISALERYNETSSSNVFGNSTAPISGNMSKHFPLAADNYVYYGGNNNNMSLRPDNLTFSVTVTRYTTGVAEEFINKYAGGPREYRCNFQATNLIQCQLRTAGCGDITLNSPRTILAGDKHVISVMINGSQARLYVNGTEVQSQLGWNGWCPSTGANFKLGHYSPGTLPFDGMIDDVVVWNRTVNPSNFSALLIHNASYLMNLAPPPAVVNNITVNVFNLLNNSNITYWNLTVTNGTTTANFNSTGNATIDLWGIEASTYNLTFSVRDHIDRFIPNIALTNTTQNFSFWQGYVNISLQTMIKNLSVNNFNATLYDFGLLNQSNASSSDRRTAILPINVGQSNITLSRGGFTPINITHNLSSVRAWDTIGPFNLSNMILAVNVTENINGTFLNNYTLTLVNFTYNANMWFNVTTTTSWITLENNISWIAQVENDEILTQNHSIVTNHTETIHYQTISGVAFNTVNITSILYEPTRTPILNGTKYVDVIGDYYAVNITFANTTNFTFLQSIPAGPYELRYGSEGFQERRKFIDTTVNGTAEVQLYLLDNANSTQVTFNVYDQFAQALENATIIAERYYIDENGYIAVEEGRTNFVGRVDFHLRRYNVFYRFKVLYEDRLIYQTGETEIEDDPQTFTLNVNTDEQILEDLQLYQGTIMTLNFTNTTNLFTFAFSDTNGLVRYGCLEVEKISILEGNTPINSSCVYASSGTIQIAINGSDPSLFNAIGYLANQNGEAYAVIQESVNLDQRYQTFGLFGIFLAFIVTGFILGFAGANGPISVIFGIAGMVCAVVAGFIYGMWSTIIIFIVMGAVIFFKVRS